MYRFKWEGENAKITSFESFIDYLSFAIKVETHLQCFDFLVSFGIYQCLINLQGLIGVKRFISKALFLSLDSMSSLWKHH